MPLSPNEASCVCYATASGLTVGTRTAWRWQLRVRYPDLLFQRLLVGAARQSRPDQFATAWAGFSTPPTAAGCCRSSRPLSPWACLWGWVGGFHARPRLVMAGPRSWDSGSRRIGGTVHVDFSRLVAMALVGAVLPPENAGGSAPI